MIQEVQAHLHSFMVHFPIVIIIIATIYDLFGTLLRKTFTQKQGLWLWLLAFLTLFAAIATGPDEHARGNTDFINPHQNLALLATIITFFVLAIRTIMLFKKNPPVKSMLTVYCILMLLSTLTILAVGYYGGKMVYTEGIGVKLDGEYINPPKQEKPHKNS